MKPISCYQGQTGCTIILCLFLMHLRVAECSVDRGITGGIKRRVSLRTNWAVLYKLPDGELYAMGCTREGCECSARWRTCGVTARWHLELRGVEGHPAKTGGNANVGWQATARVMHTLSIQLVSFHLRTTNSLQESHTHHSFLLTVSRIDSDLKNSVEYRWKYQILAVPARNKT